MAFRILLLNLVLLPGFLASSEKLLKEQEEVIELEFQSSTSLNPPVERVSSTGVRKPGSASAIQ